MRRTSDPQDVLGNASLTTFDYCIVGSGAGGAAAAHVLTAAGKTVLVLEAGHNPFPGLDDPAGLHPPLHSNDELKYEVREYLDPSGFLEPRTFRVDTSTAGSLEEDVNHLPKAVGGAFQHADGKSPRFNTVDFRLKSTMEALLAAPGNGDLAVPGFGADAASANFVDWPIGYDELEPFYVEAERLLGVQGRQGDNVYESPRSQPYPMPPGAPMYVSLLLAQGAAAVVLADHGPLVPHTYPGAINSGFYGNRPPCNDCGPCSGFGCPNHAKGSPAVTTLRSALLTGRCQLLCNAQVTELVNDGGHVSAVTFIDGGGNQRTVMADAFILAASPIESARLCLLSPTPAGGALGNSSGQLGQNLMFHLQTQVSGFFPQRIHGQRGRAVTHGVSDFRGVLPGGDAIRILTDADGRHVAMGGICEFGASQGLPITEDGTVYAIQLPGGPRTGLPLKSALRDLALGQHLGSLTMQAEDAPQRTNFVDLDGRYTDVYGSPVARVTYKSHAYELASRTLYLPYLKQILTNAGAAKVFVTPINPLFVGPPSSRHILGTLRMGATPATSVVSADRPGKKLGQFHDVDNLFACDGSVFPTSSGYNPTLTIVAVALRIAHGLAGTTP
jgi:gluconate 2-dehydrogenase alpha chain